MGPAESQEQERGGGQIPALLLQGGGNAGQDWKAEAVAVVCH